MKKLLKWKQKILMNSDFENYMGHTNHYLLVDLCAPFFTIFKTKVNEVKDIKEYSEMFKREYEIEDTIRIVNTRQAGLYVKNNIPLVDLFWSRDTLVFVFDREQSKKAYDLWCKHELN